MDLTLNITTVSLLFMLFSFRHLLVSGEESAPGMHCMNTSMMKMSQSFQLPDQSVHIHCIKCFLPQNCVGNNSCLQGTTGNTCEKCDRNGYQRIGNACAVCDTVPLSTVGFAVYLLFLILVSICTGFTSSLCTKLKIMCHFLQLLYLTFHLKIRWPELVLKVGAISSFSNFNSYIVNLDCMFRNLSHMVVTYLEWTSTFALLLVVLFTMALIDRSLKLVLRLEKNPQNRSATMSRRATIRRLLFFVFVVMYMPLTVSAFHTFLCSDTVPVEHVFDHSRSVFLYDQTTSCNGLFFQLLNFIAALILAVCVVLMPLILAFFALRQRKWGLLAKTEMTYGSVYESYCDRCCFWETLPMLRKLLTVAITDLYPLDMMVQCIVLLSLTGLYLLLLVLLRPYRTVTLSNSKLHLHLAFEIFANLVIAFAQGLALLIVFDLYVTELDYVIVSASGTVVFIGLLMLIIAPMEEKTELTGNIQATGNEEELKASTSQGGILKKRNKVAPKTFAEEVKEHQENIDF